MAAEVKPRWGRDAAAEAGRPRFGLRSLLCGLLALLLVAGSFVFLGMRSGTEPDALETVATILALASYLIAAPILHIVGIVYGLRGLIAGNGRVLSGVGLLLNLALVGVGIYVGALAFHSMGAFR